MEGIWLCQHSDKGLSRQITLVESNRNEEEPEDVYKRQLNILIVFSIIVVVFSIITH